MTGDSIANLLNDSIFASHFNRMITHSVCEALDKREAKGFDGSTVSIIGLILVGGALIITLWFLIKTIRKNKFESEHKRNFKDVGKWVFILTTFLVGLCLLGFINPTNTKGFLVSHGDMLLMVASIIAIIGAVWAVFARIDAERAFTESKNAFTASENALNESIQTRLSFGNSFNFLTIFDEENSNKKLPNIIRQIGGDNSTVSLYIGFPCIGFFYKKSATESERIDVEKITDNFYNLITKLDEITEDNSEKSYTINLGIFDKSEIKECFRKKNDSSDYNPVEILYKPKGSLSHDINRNLLTDWESVIKKLETKKLEANWSKKKKVEIIYFKRKDERFRFASVHQKNEKNEHVQNALIWVVPDFYYTNTIEFSSAGFQTSSISIIEMLDKIFTMEKHILIPADNNKVNAIKE